ncbi:polysaccharide biosynthesis protein [Donghicola sp. XS_ASV15]|uniref:polysaccharide biosynthesis protein n=1 Tax=Donghicola sp. XS_ASV15 TaxID=3241295 RepID=UPI0035120F16
MLLYNLLMRMTRAHKTLLILALDVVVAPISLLIALHLVGLSWVVASQNGIEAALMFGSVAIVAMGAALILGLHHIRLNSYDMACAGLSTLAALAVAVIGGTLVQLFGIEIPLRAWIATAACNSLLSIGARALARQVLLAVYRRGDNRLRIVIYGAGQTGQQLAAALKTDRTTEIIGFVDDNPTLQSQTVSGLRVHSPIKIKSLCDKMQVDRVILAMPSVSLPRQRQISRRLNEMGCETRLLPSFADMMNRSAGNEEQRFDANAVLNRARLEDQIPQTGESYAGKVVMITGAGGSIGSELCRQIVACKPRKIVLVDHSEFALYAISKELNALNRKIKIASILLSVTDRKGIERVMRSKGVQVVLHAAAYKHVPMVENNEIAGLWNNVFGTKITAEAARAVGVERFILVSTDKAVRPSNIMGASKRLAELVIQDLATRNGGTRFSMVRFGNVLGSSGSIIPLFEEQIAAGGPVTVTHPEVTRFFMTIPEASRLVLLAGSFTRGGDVFVLDMGQPVRIAQVARQMIEASGYSVRDHENKNGDIEIRYIGLRPGEKLHEELLIGQDMLTTPHPKILRARESHLSEIQVASALNDLRLAIEAGDTEAVRAAAFKWSMPDDDFGNQTTAQLIS